MYTAAVTGTNGKTTTTEFARQLLARSGLRAVSVGNLGTTDDDGSAPTPFFLSRPGCWAEHLGELAFDYDAAVVEAFSAGLSLGEWDGTDLDTAVLTTFGPDHLEYHGGEADYARSKLRLFERGLGPGGTAVLNRGCSLYPEAAATARAGGQEVITYGEAGDVGIRHVAESGQGLGTTLDVFGTTVEIEVPVPARFLVDNAMAALCVAVAGGIPAAAALEGIPLLVTPTGRMQHTRTPSGADVFVDFAHNPEALEAALLSARRRAAGAVRLVFGCGGRRDTAKRRLMGEIATRLADHVIVTDDNPRSESARAIRWMIVQACPGAEEIPDRSRAIESAVGAADRGDVILICGRGAESTQDFGDHTVDCNDIAAVNQAIMMTARE